MSLRELQKFSSRRAWLGELRAEVVYMHESEIRPGSGGRPNQCGSVPARTLDLSAPARLPPPGSCRLPGWPASNLPIAAAVLLSMEAKTLRQRERSVCSASLSAFGPARNPLCNVARYPLGTRAAATRTGPRLSSPDAHPGAKLLPSGEAKEVRPCSWTSVG